MIYRTLWLALVFAGPFAVSPATVQAASCPASATPVLLLGTWHMDNPGKDMLNLKTDDVLAPQRQKEIEDLVNHLAKFRLRDFINATPGYCVVNTESYLQ